MCPASDIKKPQELQGQITSIDTSLSVDQIDRWQLDALDYVVWKNVVAQQFGTLVHNHKNTATGRIDMEAVQQDFVTKWFDTREGRRSYFAQNQHGNEQSTVEMILGQSVFAQSYKEWHLAKKVIEPMWDAVQKCVWAYHTLLDDAWDSASWQTPQENEGESQATPQTVEEAEKNDEATKKAMALAGVTFGVVWWFAFLKKLFGSKSKEEKKERKKKSFWWKLSSSIWSALGWWWWAALGVGLGTKAYLDWKEGKDKLTFAQAIEQLPVLLRNVHEEEMSNKLKKVHMEWSDLVSTWYVSRDQETWLDVDERTQINLANKTIVWPWLWALPLGTNEELVFVANMINYIKSKYRWTCASENPFRVNPSTGDIHIATRDGEPEVISWWLASTLYKYAPTINGHKTWLPWQYKKDYSWRQALIQYLESLQIWIPPEDPEIDRDTPENIAAGEVQKEIEARGSKGSGQRWSIEAKKISPVYSDFQYPNIKMKGLDL